MRVFLIRHAHAVDADEDPVRPLSAKGRDQVRALAKFLQKTGVLAGTEFWHSPLARSRETAELLARRLHIDVALKLVPGLEPEDDPVGVRVRIQSARRSFAIIGHEPQLSAVASLLVAGRTEPAAFVMKKCAALALERDGTHWHARWQVSPEVIA